MSRLLTLTAEADADERAIPERRPRCPAQEDSLAAKQTTDKPSHYDR